MRRLFSTCFLAFLFGSIYWGLGATRCVSFAAMLYALQGMQLLGKLSCKGCRCDDWMCTILATACILLLSQHISECFMLKLLIFAMCSLGEGVAESLFNCCQLLHPESNLKSCSFVQGHCIGNTEHHCESSSFAPTPMSHALIVHTNDMLLGLSVPFHSAFVCDTFSLAKFILHLGYCEAGIRATGL